MVVLSVGCSTSFQYIPFHSKAGPASGAAMVPLRELLGYATALRSITGGEGSFSMELAGYGPMDAATAKAALAESW
jgi:translation elongation factor EF-G